VGKDIQHFHSLLICDMLLADRVLCKQAVKTRTMQSPDVGSWEELDSSATLAMHPNAAPDLRQAVIDTENDYNAEKGRPLSHWNAGRACMGFGSTLLAPVCK